MIEKVIVIEAKTSGFKEAQTQIDQTASSQDNLNQATSEYSGALGTVDASMGKLLGKVNILGVNLGDVYGSLKDNIKGIGGLSKGLKTARAGIAMTTVSTNAFTVALAATGVGLIVIALGLLVAAFASTQQGMDKVNKILQPLKAQFETIVGIVQDLSRNLGLLLKGDFLGFFKKSKEAVGDFGAKMEEAAERGKRLAEITKELVKAQINVAKETAAANVKLEDARAIMEDINATDEDRIKAALAAKEAINQRYDAEAKLAALQIEELKIKQKNNDTTDEELLQLAELEASFTKLTSARKRELTQIDKKEDRIAKQAQSRLDKAEKEKKKAAEKATAAANKVAADNAKRTAETLIDEADFISKRKEKQQEFEDFKIARMEEGIEKDKALSSLKLTRVQEDIDAEKALLDMKYADDADKLKILESEAQIAKANALLVKQEADAKADADELARITLQEEAKRALLEEFVLQDEEKELEEKELLEEEEAVELEELEEKDSLDKAKLQKALEDQLISAEEHAQALVIIDKNAEIEKDKTKKKFAALEKKRKHDALKDGLQTASNLAGAINGLVSTGFDLAEQTGKQDEKSKEKRAKKRFITEKALGIVTGAINTALAVTNALGTNPGPLAFVSAGLAAATGIANIAIIASKKFDPGTPSDSGTKPSAPTPPSVETTTTSGEATPSFELFGTGGSGSQAGPGTDESANSQGFRAYVVESDITDTSDRLSTIRQSSEL